MDLSSSRSSAPNVPGRLEAARPEPNRLRKLRAAHVFRALRYRIDTRRFARGIEVTSCPGLLRIGSKYGGWTVPDDALHAGSVCYLAGVGEDASFDLGLIDRYQCVVHAFDPTPPAKRFAAEATAGERRFRFLEYGLWSSDGELRFYVPKGDGDSSHSALNPWGTSDFVTAPVRSLRSIMADHGHEHIDLLKLDIEGAEYPVLQSLLKHELEVKIICVEFHGKAPWAEAHGLLRALEAFGYAVVSLSGFEVTLVREDVLDALRGGTATPIHSPTGI